MREVADRGDYARTICVAGLLTQTRAARGQPLDRSAYLTRHRVQLLRSGFCGIRHEGPDDFDD